MIDCTPEVMSFSINFHKDFIEMPLPITRLQAPSPSLFDLACELRAKPVPPLPDRFIAYIHAAFMKKVFHISQWKWKSHIKHDCKLDDLRTGFEVAEWNLIGHSWVANCQASLRQGGLFWQCRFATFKSFNFTRTVLSSKANMWLANKSELLSWIFHMFHTFHQYPHPDSHYQPLNAKAFIEIAIFDTLVALFKGSSGKHLYGK